MSVGYAVDKTQIDNVVGALARQIQTWTPQVQDFKTLMDATPEADLETMGYTPDEVALLKSGTNDMFTLAQVYLGVIDHTPAAALNVFVDRMAGLPPVR